MQEKNKSQKICKRKHKRFYPSSVLVPYVQSPSNPLKIFLILILILPKINSLYTTWQSSFCQICTTILYTKKTTTLWMNTMNPISLEFCMWLWTRSFIGGLNRIGIVWITESRSKFSEKQNFWTKFWVENLCFELVNSS